MPETVSDEAEQHCVRLRALVHDCLAKHMYEAAAFFADKLVTLSRGAQPDVYILAQVGECIVPRRAYADRSGAPVVSDMHATLRWLL